MWAGGLDADIPKKAASRLGELNELIELIRPAVQADGGDMVLVSADVETGVVEVQLQDPAPAPSAAPRFKPVSRGS